MIRIVVFITAITVGPWLTFRIFDLWYHWANRDDTAETLARELRRQRR